jgi:hypothetical protein
MLDTPTKPLTPASLDQRAVSYAEHSALKDEFRSVLAELRIARNALGKIVVRQSAPPKTTRDTRMEYNAVLTIAQNAIKEMNRD